MLFGDPNATNPLTMLDGLVYLTPNEATLTEEMVPMIENTRLHTILVDYCYAKELPNINEGCTVVVDEADVVLNPSILSKYQHMVVRPISEDDEEFRFVEDACYQYLGEGAQDDPADPNYKYKIVTLFNNRYRKLHPTGPETQDINTVDQVVNVLNKLFPNLNPHFLNKVKIKKLLDRHHHFANFTDQTIVDLVGLGVPKFGLMPKVAAPPKTPTLQRYLLRAKDALWDNKGKISAGLVAAAGAAGLYKYITHKLESKPKSAIGKRIAALRHIYTSWMEKARRATDSGIAVKLRKAAATVLQVIDMLLSKIQNSAERTFRMGGGMA